MAIDVERFLRIKKHMNQILADNTGRTVEEIQRDTERDHWFTADEAKEYGLVDQVIHQR